MAKRKTYDDEFRAGALILLEGAGYPNTVGALQRVADRLGLPTRTLRRWYTGQQNPPPDKVVVTLKKGIVELLDDIIFGVALEVKRRIDNQDEIAEVALNHLMTAFGIAVDKKQLLDGKPTERISHMESMLENLQPDEYAAIVREAEQVIASTRGSHIGDTQQTAE